jgi:acetyl esterase/lipase
MIKGVYNKCLATIIRSIASVECETHQDEILQVPSRDVGRSIRVHVYKPTEPAPPQGPTPVLINFHGSGYVIPMHGSDDEFALKIRSSLPYTVLDVQYRLAPEEPFPAATDDAEDVVKYVLAKPTEFDLSHVSVSGFSAGGALALGAAGHVFPVGTFRHVVAIYPPTDLTIDPSNKHAPDQSGKSLPNWMTASFNNMYAPPPIDRSQPLISPSKIDPTRFPKNVLIITCGFDNLALETEDLAERIRRVPGINLEHKRMEKVGHAWDKEYKPDTHEEKAKDAVYDLAVEMLSI